MVLTDSSESSSIPLALSLQPWVSPYKLRRALEYVTLWSATPSGVKVLEERAIGRKRISSAQAPHSGLCVFTSKEYGEYREVLETVQENTDEILFSRNSPVSVLTKLQRKFGYTEGHQLYCRWITEPSRYVQDVVNRIGKAIEYQFILPYCCGECSMSNAESIYTVSPKDFDIHVQMFPRRLTKSEKSENLGMVANACIRFLPSLKARERMLRLVEFSMVSCKARDQTLNSSLAFWDSVHEKLGRRSNTDESVALKAIEEANEELKQHWGAIDALPVLNPPFTRKVDRSLLQSSDEDEETNISIAVPVITSLPTECESVCTTTRLCLNLKRRYEAEKSSPQAALNNPSNFTSSATRIAADRELASAMWKSVRELAFDAASTLTCEKKGKKPRDKAVAHILAFDADSGANNPVLGKKRSRGREESDFNASGSPVRSVEAERSGDDEGSSCFFVSRTIHGSWRSVSLSQELRMKAALHSSSSVCGEVENAVDSSSLPSGYSSPAAHTKMLSECRKSWEKRVRRGSDGFDSAFSPVWAQPDVALVDWPHLSLVAKGESNSFTFPSKPKGAKGSPLQWGGVPDCGANNLNEDSINSVDHRSHCGLVAYFCFSLDGMGYLSYPLKEQVSTCDSKPNQTAKALKPTTDFAAERLKPDPSCVDISVLSAPSPIKFLPTVLSLEDSSSFTRWILGLS